MEEVEDEDMENRENYANRGAVSTTGANRRRVADRTGSQLM